MLNLFSQVRVGGTLVYTTHTMLELILNERKTKCNQMDETSGTMRPNKVNSGKLRESTWATMNYGQKSKVFVSFMLTQHILLFLITKRKSRRMAISSSGY